MKFFAYAFLFLISFSGLEAAQFSFGAAGGMEFPLWHTDRQEPGARAEAFYRIDPFEVRFHYAYTKAHYYSILLAQKHFFTNDEIRPFFEAALGPAFVSTPGEGLGYGLSPEISFGAELGINENFSTHIVTRYSSYLYFGDTASGSMEANHSLSVVAGMTLWF